MNCRKTVPTQIGDEKVLKTYINNCMCEDCRGVSYKTQNEIFMLIEITKRKLISTPGLGVVITKDDHIPFKKEIKNE